MILTLRDFFVFLVLSVSALLSMFASVVGFFVSPIFISLNPLPGIIFGLALIFAVWVAKKEVSSLTAFTIIVLSAIGYCAASLIAFPLFFPGGKITSNPHVSVSIASALGYIIVSISILDTKQLVKGVVYMVFGVILAGLIGYINTFYPLVSNGGWGVPLPFQLPKLFFSWQVILGLYLYYQIRVSSEFVVSRAISKDSAVTTNTIK